ncbi:hypothetical protein BDV3_003778 [Batrachochytrium dendrobatidis]
MADAGGHMQLPVEQWYFDIPVITRLYSTCVVLMTLACQLDLVSPYRLFYSWTMVWKAKQYWRVITTFLYFGSFSVDFLFHMFFLVQYCRMLEEGSFRGRTHDFLWMFVIGATSMVLISSLFDANKEVPFLSSAFTFMLTYVWSRRNPSTRINFLGLFNFDAPYLPWVLIGFTLVFHGVTPWADFIGLAVGHGYYYLEDVYPHLRGSHGHRPLATPAIVERAFEWMESVSKGNGGYAAVLPDAMLPDADGGVQEHLHQD